MKISALILDWEVTKHQKLKVTILLNENMKKMNGKNYFEYVSEHCASYGTKNSLNLATFEGRGACRSLGNFPGGNFSRVEVILVGNCSGVSCPR